MAINNAVVAGIVAKNGQWIADSATSIYQTQWASAASAAQNEEEQAEYIKLSESMKYMLSVEGSSVTLAEQAAETSPFQSIIEEGMSAPLIGGQGGTVTEPDGSTRESNVPSQLWESNTLPEYAKAPNPVSEGIETMLQTLVPTWVDEAASDSGDEIAELVKPEIIQEIQAALG